MLNRNLRLIRESLKKESRLRLRLIRESLKNESRVRRALKNQSRLRRRRTVFHCIGPDGKITDEGWALLDLPNPHKKKKR